MRKNTTNEYRFFLQSNFVGVNKLFTLVYKKKDNNAKRFNTRKYYLPKKIIGNYSVIINGMIFYDQFIDFDIKQYEEIRKLAMGINKLTTKVKIVGCLLDFDYFKNCYRLIFTD